MKDDGTPWRSLSQSWWGYALVWPPGGIIARQAPDSSTPTTDGQAEWEEEASDLAKKTQNPVSDLISVPVQSNVNFGYGPRDNTQLIINVQPVVPFKLGNEWNLITRTIVPLIAHHHGGLEGGQGRGRMDGPRRIRCRKDTQDRQIASQCPGGRILQRCKTGSRARLEPSPPGTVPFFPNEKTGHSVWWE